MTQAHHADRARHCVADMLVGTQLSPSDVALELGIDEMTVRQWIDGTSIPSRLAMNALQALTLRRGPDADAISAACRMAGLQARTDAARFIDPVVSEGLLRLAATYERIAAQFDGRRIASNSLTATDLDLPV